MYQIHPLASALTYVRTRKTYKYSIPEKSIYLYLSSTFSNHSFLSFFLTKWPEHPSRYWLVLLTGSNNNRQCLIAVDEVMRNELWSFLSESSRYFYEVIFLFFLIVDWVSEWVKFWCSSEAVSGLYWRISRRRQRFSDKGTGRGCLTA